MRHRLNPLSLSTKRPEPLQKPRQEEQRQLRSPPRRLKQQPKPSDKSRHEYVPS